MNKKVKVTIKIKGDKRKGSCWSKAVTGIDNNAKDGYMFVGDFLKNGEVLLEIGTVILQVETHGSWKNNYQLANLGVVNEQGKVEWQNDATGVDWSLLKVSLAEKCVVLLSNNFDSPSEDKIEWSHFLNYIPEELIDWITFDEGIVCVNCILKFHFDNRKINQSNYKSFLIPVPLKNVLRDYLSIGMLNDDNDGYYDYIISVDLPYSEKYGLVTDPEVLANLQTTGEI